MCVKNVLKTSNHDGYPKRHSENETSVPFKVLYDYSVSSGVVL